MTNDFLFNSFESSDANRSGITGRRGCRVPVSAIGHDDIQWFVLTYEAGSPAHLPQSLAASYVVCEPGRADEQVLCFYLDFPWGGLCVARIPSHYVSDVSAHAASDEATHASDLAWGRGELGHHSVPGR